jgi:hypothetical protein
MVDVDELYSVLVLYLRANSDDPHLAASSLMPTLLATFEKIWDDGHAAGVLAWAPEPPPGNPYRLKHYPGWHRRARPGG